MQYMYQCSWYCPSQDCKPTSHKNRASLALLKTTGLVWQRERSQPIRAQRGIMSDARTSLVGWMTQQMKRINSGIKWRLSGVERYYSDGERERERELVNNCLYRQSYMIRWMLPIVESGTLELQCNNLPPLVLNARYIVHVHVVCTCA